MLYFKEYLIFLDKITDNFIGHNEIKEWIVLVFKQYKDIRKPIKEVWISNGGMVENNLFILPNNLLKIDYKIVFSFNSRGENYINFNNNPIIINLDISEDLIVFEKALDHELSHISNLIIKRKNES